MAQKRNVHEAAHNGDLVEVTRQLEENPNLLTLQDSNGRMLIHWAVLSGNVNLVNHLFDLGSPVDPVDDTEMTPLILAASAGKSEITNILLGKNASVNNKNTQGHSALQYACSKGWIEIVRILLNNGADVNIADIRCATPLHRAASKGNTAIVELLLAQQDMKVDTRDTYGCTALHLACEEDRQEDAKLLVEHGAQVDIRNKDCKTPLELCTPFLAKLLKALVNKTQ